MRENIQKKKCIEDVSRNPAFNKLYHLVVALAFVPPDDIQTVVDDILNPYVDMIEENLSPGALDWWDYFVSTYVGSINPRTNRCSLLYII